MICDMPLYTEVWTIDEAKKEELNSFLNANSLTMDYLQTVFKTHGAALLQFGPVQAELKPRAAAQTITEKPSLLWQDKQVAVYMPPNPRVPHHLWVVLKRPVEGLCDVTQEEYAELRKSVHKIQYLLRTEFKLPTFIAQWNQPQPGHLSKRYTIEVIPARPESATFFDLLDKAECNNHLLWRGIFPTLLPTPSKEEIAKTTVFWQSALKKETPSLSTHPFSEPLDVEPVLRVRQTETIKAFRDAIFQILQEHFPIERKTTTTVLEIPDRWARRRDSCTFCTKELIDAEKVYESHLSYVLYNYKPLVPGAHFLIFPKRHVLASENLREDELKDIHKLASLLVQMLEEKEKRSDIVLFTQDHPVLAQSVPHSHTHVVLTPPMLRFFVFTMNYALEGTLSREEMLPILEEIRSWLKQHTEAATEKKPERAAGG